MPARKSAHVVHSLKIASPCKADWNSMVGDDRQRFCSSCKKNVYNVSGLSSEEVLALIQKAEGESGEFPCMRLRKRRDGSVITGDCPVGLRRVRRRLMVITSLVAGFFGLATWSSNRPGAGETIMGKFKQQVIEDEAYTTMGEIMAPPEYEEVKQKNNS